MDFLQPILVTCFFYLCNGQMHTGTAPDLHLNVINSNETGSSRQAGYSLVRFQGPTDHDSDIGYHEPQTFTFAVGRPNTRPLKFEDDVNPYSTTQDNLNPSATTQNIVSFKDDGNHKINDQTFNQISGQKKRRRRRRRKSRRVMDDVKDIRFTPGGQPIITQQQAPRPNLNEMMGPLRVISDALGSIIQNDSKRCVRRMLCEQAATNDQIHNSTLMQTVLRVFQYIPLLQRSAAINALPLADSVGLISVAMRYGAAARNVSACKHRYPDCPDDPEERIHYLNNHQGGLFRFFRGNDQHQYSAAEFHNQLLQLGLKPQPHPNAYGLYQPQHGPKGEQLAHPYPFHYGFQKPNSYTPEHYGLQQQNFQPNSHNSHGLYQNQPAVGTSNRFSNHFSGQVNSNQQGSSIYGPAYPHNRRSNSDGVGFKSDIKYIEDSSSQIQRRIQNKPVFFKDDNNYVKFRWTFPEHESVILNIHNVSNNIRGGRQIKFPNMENGQETVKQAKGFLFPGAQSDRQYSEFINDISADDDLRVDNFGYVDAAEELQNAVDVEDVEVVYVVRGNGDPRYPEIVKLRPGEKFKGII